MQDIKVNEIIKVNNKYYKCVLDKYNYMCEKCVGKHNKLCDNLPECRASKRIDGSSVCYVKSNIIEYIKFKINKLIH